VTETCTPRPNFTFTPSQLGEVDTGGFLGTVRYGDMCYKNEKVEFAEQTTTLSTVIEVDVKHGQINYSE
jgi:hypothetical protein